MKFEIDFSKASNDDIRRLIKMLKAYLGEHHEEKVIENNLGAAAVNFDMFETVANKSTESEKKEPTIPSISTYG